MTIKNEAFLALEATLGKRLQRDFADYAYPILQKIETAMKLGDYFEASRIASAMDLREVLEGAKPFILWVTNLAMLFGASRVTQRPGTTVVGMGYEKDTIQQFVAAFVHNAAYSGTTYVVEQAMQLIAAKSKAPTAAMAVPALQIEKAELEHVAKAPDVTDLTSYDPKKSVLVPFSSFVNEAGKAYFNMVSSLHTSRVSAYGFTAEADALDIEEYALNEQLDNRICPVCRLLHGSVFSVRDARATLDVVLRVSSKEDLVNLQPWPSQSKKSLEAIGAMTKAELVAKGWHIPPFHPRCRGLLVKVGKAPPLTDIDAGTVKDTHLTGEADFEAIGQSSTPTKINAWNKSVKVTPAEVVATATGVTPDVYLAKQVQSLDPKADSGVTSITTQKDVVKVNLNSPMFGSSEPVAQSLKFDADGLTVMKFSPASNADYTPQLIKQYLKGLYQIAQEGQLAKLSVAGVDDYSSYAFAKAGFTPKNAAQWEAMKKGAYKQLEAAGLMQGADDTLKAALDAIKASPDPTMALALADLSVGEAALTGIVYDAALDLASAEAVAKFLDYFGSPK